VSRQQAHKEQALVKMLRYVLGVAPAEFGLLPDEAGWVSVKELLAALHQEEGWRHLRQGMLADAANRLAPELIELADNRLRCAQRSYPPPDYEAQPPAHLYLGARRKAWPVMHKRGLEAGPGGRPWLLAADPDRALSLGRRRDPEPMLVTVQAQPAAEQGAAFAAWGEYFLCEWAPAACLMGPPVEEAPPAKKPVAKAPPAKEAGPALPPPGTLPGSFILTAEDVEKPYKRKGISKDIAWKRERRKGRKRG